jgi:hypothetical protein
MNLRQRPGIATRTHLSWQTIVSLENGRTFEPRGLRLRYDHGDILRGVAVPIATTAATPAVAVSTANKAG